MVHQCGFGPALPCSATDFDGRHFFQPYAFAHVHNWNEIPLSKKVKLLSAEKCYQCIHQDAFTFK